jgi:hypothetical protein
LKAISIAWSSGSSVPGGTNCDRVAAGYVLQGNVTGILVDGGVEDGRDVRMRELARQRSLGEELLEPLAILRRIGDHRAFEHLERNFGAGKRVLRQIHHATGALAQIADRYIFPMRRLLLQPRREATEMPPTISRKATPW